MHRLKRAWKRHVVMRKQRKFEGRLGVLDQLDWPVLLLAHVKSGMSDDTNFGELEKIELLAREVADRAGELIEEGFKRQLREAQRRVKVPS